MGDSAMRVPEVARLLSPFISKAGLYKWIERKEIKAERTPGNRWIIRESEVVRVLAWYEGVEPEEVRQRLHTLLDEDAQVAEP